MLARLSFCRNTNVIARKVRYSVKSSLHTTRNALSANMNHGPIKQLVLNRTVSKTVLSNQMAAFSTREGWNSKVKTDLDGLTPIDVEKTLFRIKRKMGMHHSKGAQQFLLTIPQFIALLEEIVHDASKLEAVN